MLTRASSGMSFKKLGVEHDSKSTFISQNKKQKTECKNYINRHQLFSVFTFIKVEGRRNCREGTDVHDSDLFSKGGPDIKVKVEGYLWNFSFTTFHDQDKSLSLQIFAGA